ncbi:MAG TPA: leishmanolysin-related zinc metalloendopeptidase [Gemmatimonadaceae bacterium]|nr:leishmanolysin-related zinc metalloendopeptidase [Gemmatimonadaceae bacterium]
MIRLRALTSILLPGALALAGCRDNGPDAGIVVVAGAPQSVLAGTVAPTPIQVLVRGPGGDPMPNEPVTFTVVSGGGAFTAGGATATATTGSDGVATAPGWRMGKSDVPQVMRATAAGMTLEDITIQIQSDYEITIRFFGPPMSAAQQALFTNAAARISGIITGDLTQADPRPLAIDPDTTDCQTTGQPVLNEVIDDVLIYASIRDLDGPGNVLAQAGACFVRPHPTQTSPPHAAIGTMQFDAADIQALSGSGSLQDVITHEMLHVLGLGVLWGSPRNFLLNGQTGDPRYTGTQGLEGCRSIGGSIACATSLPVENTGGDGTQDSHWRESTFNTELMTGFLDAGANPISLMTVGALADLGFVVNPAAADEYSIFSNAFRSEAIGTAGPRPVWEVIIRPTGVIEGRTLRQLRP